MTATPSSLSGGAYLRLVGLGALLGIPAALVASLFLALVHDLEHWLWDSLPSALGATSPPWYLVVGLPVAGACIVIAGRLLLPGDGGHPPLEGIGGGATPVRYAPGIALAAIGTLSFGAVLGPEAPLIALGSAVGLLAVKLAKITGPEGKVLDLAGSFSAISALFGGPVVRRRMMTQAPPGPSARVPGFVAAGVGYVIFVGLGDWGGLGAQGITVSGLPAYNGTHVLDLLVALAVGVAAAIAVKVTRGLATDLKRRGESRGPMPAL